MRPAAAHAVILRCCGFTLRGASVIVRMAEEDSEARSGACSMPSMDSAHAVLVHHDGSKSRIRRIAADAIASIRGRRGKTWSADTAHDVFARPSDSNSVMLRMEAAAIASRKGASQPLNTANAHAKLPSCRGRNFGAWEMRLRA